jgi:hypothetical protein
MHAENKNIHNIKQQNVTILVNYINFALLTFIQK